MTNKKQPRICEVLGVQEGQEFTADYARYVILNGRLWKLGYGEKQKIGGKEVCWLINNTERINRCKPRPTAEQLEELKLLYERCGVGWITKDCFGRVFAHHSYPEKNGGIWYEAESDSVQCNMFSGLVSRDDPEPLDILQTLKDNGVEVEG